MATRKQIIIKHYLEFQKQLHDKNFDCSIFPSLEDVCLVDLLVLFNYTFNNSNPIAQSLDEVMKKAIELNVKINKEIEEIGDKNSIEKNLNKQHNIDIIF
jgi:hypothetical protein